MIKGKIRNILVPCNKCLYDIDAALKDLNEIHYRQFVNVQPGALVYIYVGQPFEQALVYVCRVVEVNETKDLINDASYILKPNELKNNPGRYMRIRLEKALNPGLFDFHTLKEHGLKSCLQGQCYVPPELQEYLDSKIK